MDYPKSNPDSALLDGKFTDGDPVNGVPPSLDPASWANLVTDEILNVLAEANIAPDEAVNTQLRDAILEIISANAAPIVKNNLSAAVDPGVNDDSTAGYAVTSRWLNAASKEMFVCLDATAGAAQWQTITLTLDDLGTAATRNVGTGASDIRQNSDNDARYAQLGAANNFTADQTITGNLTVTGTVKAG